MLATTLCLRCVRTAKQRPLQSVTLRMGLSTVSRSDRTFESAESEAGDWDVPLKPPSVTHEDEPASSKLDFSMLETKGKLDPTKYGGIKKEIFIRNVERTGPFIRNVFDPKLEYISNTELTWSVEYQPHMNGNIGVPAINHGALSSLAENAAFYAAWASLTDKFERVRPIESRIDHISHAPFEDFLVTAKVFHRTKHVIRVDVSVWNTLKTKRPITGKCTFSVQTVEHDLEHILLEREEKLEIAQREAAAKQQLSDLI